MISHRSNLSVQEQSSSVDTASAATTTSSTETMGALIQSEIHHLGRSWGSSRPINHDFILDSESTYYMKA